MTKNKAFNDKQLALHMIMAQGTPLKMTLAILDEVAEKVASVRESN